MGNRDSTVIRLSIIFEAPRLVQWRISHGSGATACSFTIFVCLTFGSDSGLLVDDKLALITEVLGIAVGRVGCRRLIPMLDDPRRSRSRLATITEQILVWLDEFQSDRECNEKDDDPFQDFHAPGRSLIGNFFVNAFERLQFAQDARIPLVEMKAPVDQAIEPRQVLVTDQLQGVVHTLE